MNQVHISNNQLFNINSDNNKEINKHINNHNIFIKKIINSPDDFYERAKERIKNDGKMASFPEFEDIVLYLKKNIELFIKQMYDNKDVNYNIINILGQIKLINITNIMYKTKQNYLPYDETIKTIYDILDFFDIYERLYNEKLGTYYHSLNYQYYINKMLSNESTAIIIPTICHKIGSTDFIKLRPFPIYLCGVSIKSYYVDEYYQSPKEYFIHDLNHSRRMHEKYLDCITLYKIDIISESINLKNKIIDLIHIDEKDPEIIIGLKQLIKMIIFEIIHEDALYLYPDIIWNSCHRDDNYTYVFEKTVIDNKILNVIDYPIIVEGALAYTKFKLQYQFYDNGDNEKIVIPKYRYAKYIAFAVMIMLKNLFPEKQLESYEYYLSRTSKNENIPTPVNKFKIDDKTNQTIDTTSFKTGISQNSWKNGHRRVVGEHLNLNGCIHTNPIICKYDNKEISNDFIELIKLIKLTKFENII
jgi:hypothetical protein